MPGATVNTQESARRQSNLAFSFLCLDANRRAAMGDFYDFCRGTDDIVDDRNRSDAEKHALLEQWRSEIDACFAEGGQPRMILAQRLQKIARHYVIPKAPFVAILDGLSMDIGHRRFRTFSELRHYCYGVASAVGLICIRIFGCKHPQSEAFAENLGYALQLTNILRDVIEDIREYDRIYIPSDEMGAYGVTETMLARPWEHEACHSLFKLQAFRARHFFNKSHRLVHRDDREALQAALIMKAFYEDILDRIEARGCCLGPGRVTLTKARKFQLLLRVGKTIRHPLPPCKLPATIAVLGGGVAGMTAAIALAREGHTVNLYEARRFAGGRAHSFTDIESGLILDNGQHIAMGCYHHFLKLADILGIRQKLDKQPRLNLHFIGFGGKVASFTVPSLPAPFHLLGALYGCNVLSWSDRLSILRLGLAVQSRKQPNAVETVTQWLQRYRQTPGAIRILWRPFCLAALNESLDTASAQLFYETLRRSLFGGKEASALLFAKTGLTELLGPECTLFLQGTGGDFHLGLRVAEFHFNHERLEQIEFSGGLRLQPEYCISALPWTALRALLPAHSSLCANASAMQGAPILGVHYWTENPIAIRPVTGLLDSSIHWIFDRTDHLHRQNKTGYLYSIVASAACHWQGKSATEIEAETTRELIRHFPDFAHVGIKRCVVYLARDATFAAQPESEKFRPPATTEWENFFLAGDWTQTGLPATLEGAALSGFTAARQLA